MLLNYSNPNTCLILAFAKKVAWARVIEFVKWYLSKKKPGYVYVFSRNTNRFLAAKSCIYYSASKIPFYPILKSDAIEEDISAYLSIW